MLLPQPRVAQTLTTVLQIRNKLGSCLVVQGVRDLALSPQQSGIDSWPRNFHMPLVQPKKKKKERKKKRNKLRDMESERLRHQLAAGEGPAFLQN